MNSKERILSILRNQKADKHTWVPNLPYWWESQSDEIKAKGEVAILKEMGADPMIRGRYPFELGQGWKDLYLYDQTYQTTTFTSNIIDNTTREDIYHTPIGDLTLVYTYSTDADSWFLFTHPVKTPEDFKILKYIYDDMVLVPNYKAYDDFMANWKEDGVLIAQTLPYQKTPFQSLIEYWVGTVELVYALMDFPDLVDDALISMRRIMEDACEISAASSCPAFLTWEDTSTTNISPMYYEKYIVPDINRMCDIIHSHGKIYMQHACGHLKDLMPMMAKTKIDFIESISPPPTGNITMTEAREILPDEIGLIGGLEPVFLIKCGLEELEAEVDHLLKTQSGSKYMLANSDSLPPGVSMEKLKLIGELVKKY